MSIVFSIDQIQAIQKHTNFIILIPQLPKAYNIQNFTLRKETNEQRSSIRFEVHINNQSLRIKQFFYDWAIPVITADTNLVSQGKAFEIDGIVGFIGTDYKGKQAACFSRWFTTIELSVLSGSFDDRELLMILKSLKVVDESYITKLGEQSFTTCSYTARFNKPKWNGEDEISRVLWYESSEQKIIKKSKQLGIYIPKYHDEYFCDSVGYMNNDAGEEFHFLYRSQKDYTNGFWLWVAPKELSDPLPTSTGRRVGTRQSWNIKKVRGSILHIPVDQVILCRQNAEFRSWMVHWEYDNHIFHLYFRASTQNNIKKIKALLSKLYSKGRLEI